MHDLRVSNAGGNNRIMVNQFSFVCPSGSENEIGSLFYQTEWNNFVFVWLSNLRERSDSISYFVQECNSDTK
jgi:hypothetical protein